MFGVSANREACYPITASDGAFLAYDHAVEIYSNIEIANASTSRHAKESRKDVAEANTRLGMKVVAVEPIEDATFEKPGETCD